MSTATSILLLPKAAPWTAARPMTATTYLLRKAISVMKSTTINPLLMQMNPLMLSGIEDQTQDEVLKSGFSLQKLVSTTGQPSPAIKQGGAGFKVYRVSLLSKADQFYPKCRWQLRCRRHFGCLPQIQLRSEHTEI